MHEDERIARIEQWVAEFQPVIYRAAYLILRDRSGAEDVAQETFIRAFKALDRTDPGHGARPWLYKIAVNTALNELRRRKRESSAYAKVGEAAPSEAIASSEKLPDNLRVAVICRYFLDLSEVEMGSVIGVRAGTVKSRLHLARKALAGDLEMAVER